jgi:predicted transcriptional regulator
MEDKEIYTLEELYDELPCTLTALANRAGLNEVTIARIRDGKPTRRSSVNALLRAFSEIYGRPLSRRNVTGINAQRNLREERKEQRKASKPAA